MPQHRKDPSVVSSDITLWQTGLEPARPSAMHQRLLRPPTHAGEPAGMVRDRAATRQLDRPYAGPKQQIFDYVLRKLLSPKPGPKQEQP